MRALSEVPIEGNLGMSWEVAQQGSLFWVPMDFELGLGGEAGVVPAHRGDLQEVHTLIVDNNATDREILDRYLRSWKARGEMAAAPPRIEIFRLAQTRASLQ